LISELLLLSYYFSFLRLETFWYLSSSFVNNLLTRHCSYFLQEEKGQVMKQKKAHRLSKIKLSEKTDSKTVSSDSNDEDSSGSVVLFSKPKSKKPPSSRKPSPIHPQKKAGKQKKTLWASQQQIGTANSSGCLLAKELAKLDELDRQQPPPSSRNKVILFFC